MASAPSSATAAKPLEYIDSCQNALVRLYPDGRLVTAAMAQGPNGFGIARFGDEAPRGDGAPEPAARASGGCEGPAGAEKTVSARKASSARENIRENISLL